jgi:hypothetical protein
MWERIPKTVLQLSLYIYVLVILIWSFCLVLNWTIYLVLKSHLDMRGDSQEVGTEYLNIARSWGTMTTDKRRQGSEATWWTAST